MLSFRRYGSTPFRRLRRAQPPLRSYRDTSPELSTNRDCVSETARYYSDGHCNTDRIGCRAARRTPPLTWASPGGIHIRLLNASGCRFHIHSPVVFVGEDGVTTVLIRRISERVFHHSIRGAAWEGSVVTSRSASTAREWVPRSVRLELSGGVPSTNRTSEHSDNKGWHRDFGNRSRKVRIERSAAPGLVHDLRAACAIFLLEVHS